MGVTVGIKINDDPIARAVGEFMADNGIDIRRVRTYSVTKSHGDLALLTLTMIMNDMAEPAPKPESIHLAERPASARAACTCAGSGFGDGSCANHSKTEQTDQEE